MKQAKSAEKPVKSVKLPPPTKKEEELEGTSPDLEDIPKNPNVVTSTKAAKPKKEKN